LYSEADQQQIRGVYTAYLPWVDTTLSPFRLVYSGAFFEIYENTAPHHRAWLCTEVEVIAEDDMILRRIKDDGFDPLRTVILEEQPERWQPSGDTTHPGSVEITHYEPNRIEMTAEVNKPAVLVLSENWYPYYRAWVNGEERKVYRADYTFRALPLEPGTHRIEFRYRSPYQKAGTWITFLSLALVGLVIALSLILVRRKKS
jgi:hypothetical protein